MKLSAKSFGPLVVSKHANGVHRFTSEANSTANITPKPSAEGLSPTDLILASLGACLSISLQMACEELSLVTGATHFELRATKALDEPSRIERFDVSVQIHEPLTRDQHQQLLARTKQICTISHTLNADIHLSIKT